jgi:NAD(P)H-dependent flavin oxidoreductase YrpB (nitropropane dioxygenase family)
MVNVPRGYIVTQMLVTKESVVNPEVKKQLLNNKEVKNEKSDTVIVVLFSFRPVDRYNHSLT